MNDNISRPARPAEIGGAMPRSLWKRAWRRLFWPFYRHFDILHLEVEELKSNQQSARLLHDQYQRHFEKVRQEFVHQTLNIGLLRQRLEQTSAQLATLAPLWTTRLEEARNRWEEHARSVAFRLQETAADQLSLKAAMDRIENPAGEWFDYTAFENKFRGPESEIIERQSEYLPLLKKRAVVADLGCGRGELLEVLRRANVEALGVELHPQQAQRCRDKGLHVEPADFMNWLPAQTDGAYGAITALQVVEHLHLSDVHRLMSEAFRVLRPGGLILLETVNPHSADAMEWFYIDPTHKRPVYPEILELLLVSTGFVKRELRFQSLSASAPKGTELNSKTGSDFAIWGIKP